MKNIFRIFVSILFLSALSAGQTTAPQNAATRPNILFIAIDDLRPELGTYGSKIARSPNLDKLASQGLRFDRAYCQQAICLPSRASLLTGVRPETSGVIHNYVKFRDFQPDIITLPQHLCANGYETVYHGKIFHPGDTDDERSWSRQPAVGKLSIKKPQGAFMIPENRKAQQENLRAMSAKYGDAAQRGLAMGPAWEKADVPDLLVSIAL